MAYKRIVVATDGSPTAETAERVALTLAKATKGSVAIAHAFADEARAGEIVARAKAFAEELGVKHDIVLAPDDPAEAIMRIAEERDAELIVTGSRGLFKGEQLIGSVVRKVVNNAPCDVLLTRPREDPGKITENPYAHVLLATDGSATADRAARKAYALVSRIDADMTLVFVGHPKTGQLVLDDTAATIGEGAEVGKVITQGEPGETIISVARDGAYDLVIVGNKGMAGAKAAILGSVPREIAEFAPCDVLVARTIAQNLSEITPGEGGIVTMGDTKIAVYRRPDGEVVTISAKCTHMGCSVKWNAAEKVWDCPCHGSRYAPTGEVIHGPAERALAPTEL